MSGLAIGSGLSVGGGLAISYPGGLSTGSGLSPAPVYTATTAWVNAVVANGGTVSAARQTLIFNLISASMACGHWWLTDDIALIVGENAGSALTTLKTRTLMTPVNAPTFTIDRGYAFVAASSQYINTNNTPSTMASAESLGNVRMAVYERTNVATNTVSIGASNSGTTFALRARNATSNIFSQMLAQSVTFSGITDSRGYTSSSRTGGTTTINAWKNSTAQTPVTATSANNITLMTQPLYIACQNQNGTPTAFRGVTIGEADWGAPLTDAQELAWYTALQTFMTAVGANV